MKHFLTDYRNPFFLCLNNSLIFNTYTLCQTDKQDNPYI